MGLAEQELRAWVQRVANGQASHRHLIHIMLGLGLSGPLIAEMLATAAPAAAQGTGTAPPTFTPTRRGGGGKLRLLYSLAPTLLNAHLATGRADAGALRVVYESLISLDLGADFIPTLAEEIPSLESGGRARDGTWAVVRHAAQPPLPRHRGAEGGEDVTSAARAVIQTGEFDFARNLLVDKDVMERLAHRGRKGAFHIVLRAVCT